MHFWEHLKTHGNAVALVNGDGGEECSYRMLSDAVKGGADRLRSLRKKLILLAVRNDVGGIICYLSSLASGHAVCLCDGLDRNSLNGDFVEQYRPDIVVWKPPLCPPPSLKLCETTQMFDYTVGFCDGRETDIDDQLTLLLSTSGSTGSPKLVRLSAANLQSSADQVRHALNIGAQDRAITNLPVSYVYGLSVAHSHLCAGASLIVNNRSIVDPRFWVSARDAAATSLAGVPWTYRMLKQIGFDHLRCLQIRKLTQSGGKMDDELLEWCIETFVTQGIDFYLMYGQTEAAGRIAVLPASLIRTKFGSVGRAVPNGQVSCQIDGEVVYRGPNVMNGYARCREDLARGDDLGGTLHTGDLGHVDNEGYLYITGRKSRLCKLLGKRIDLDDVETYIGKTVQNAVICDDHILCVFAEHCDQQELSNTITRLANRLGIPRQYVVVRYINAIPRSAAGKVRYEELAIPRI
jgi:long-chain acyl-CoA synthetase